MKQCSKCKEIKEDACFSRDYKNKSGLRSQCRTCSDLTTKDYRKRNREKISDKKVKYNNQHPEHIINWRAKNKEYVLQYAKRYRESHREEKRIWQQNRRMRIENAKGDGWSLEDEEQLKRDYMYICPYCGKKKKLSIDHIVPISRGGEHSLDNAAPACKTCNTSKRATPLVVWMAKKILYPQNFKS